MRISALALAIVTSSIAVLFPLQGVQGQTPAFSTSADDHGNTFFGDGVLQVIIDDPNADDDGSVEELVVEVDADPDTGSQGSSSVIVPETSDSSGRFEFYLIHVDATAVDPTDIDPINTAGVEGDGTCASDCAPFVTFGSSGDVQVDAEMYEEVTFDFTAADDEIRVNYEEAFAQVELDRSAYGSDSFVYIFVDDQDANLNPTTADEFIVDPNSPANSDLFELAGGSIENTVTFRETGDNTARFEGRYELGNSITVDSESLVLTLFDKANYGDTLDAEENDSDSTDEVSFSIGDTDGSVDVGDDTTWDAELSSEKTVYSFGENVTITVEDPDSNSNSGSVENIDLQLSTSNNSAIISASETGQNTGIFEATFQLSLDGRINGTQLKVEEGEPLSISYTDERPADYQERLDSGEDPEEEFAIEINILSNSSGGSSTSLSPPSVNSIGGSTGPLVAGGQVGLSTTIENNNNLERPFVALIEVRDSSGITVYLAWQSGSLEPADSAPIEVSWTPVVSGEYDVRTFAISSFSEGNVLSDVKTTRIVVN